MYKVEKECINKPGDKENYEGEGTRSSIELMMCVFAHNLLSQVKYRYVMPPHGFNLTIQRDPAQRMR
jgi:hypothetical protein